MRKQWVYAGILVIGCLPGTARAGSVSGGTDVSGNSPWTIEETWTNGSATLDLTISGTGNIPAGLLAILQNFVTSLPSSGWEPVSGSTTPTTGTGSGTGTTTATGTSNEPPPSPPSDPAGTGSPAGTGGMAPGSNCPPIAPVPEPSGVAHGGFRRGRLGFRDVASPRSN